MKIQHKGDYAARRKAEYPPIEEFADAVYWSTQGNDEKLRQYLAKIDEVKKKYPK